MIKLSFHLNVQAIKSLRFTVNNIKFKNVRERIYKELLSLFPSLQTKRFTLQKIIPKKCCEIKLGKMTWNLIIWLVSGAI